MSIDPKFLEALMLLCFGCSWPFAVFKTIKTKSARGKSIIFLSLIFIGYVAGVAYKITANFDHVIWIYCLNGSMVFTEIALYFIYQQKNNSPSQKLIKWYDNFFRLLSLRKLSVHSN